MINTMVLPPKPTTPTLTRHTRTKEPIGAVRPIRQVLAMLAGTEVSFEVVLSGKCRFTRAVWAWETALPERVVGSGGGLVAAGFV